MEILLIRHGVTDENLRHVMIGRTDPPLHDLGKQQAEAIAAYLRACQVDAIVTSPLLRAKETAAAISREHPHVPVRIHPGLRELDLGIVDGMSAYDAYDRERDLMNQALNPESADFAFPGGELRSDALVRFTKVMDECAAMPGQRVVVVTHGGVIGLWLTAHMGRPLGAFRANQSSHAAITVVRHERDGCEVIAYNRTEHLPDELQASIEERRSHSCGGQPQ